MPTRRVYNKQQNLDRAYRIARHECGHYIAARALGFQTGFISIELMYPAGHSGKAEITLPVALKSVAETCLYLERRIQVLYSGVLAEALEDGKINEAKTVGYIQTGGAGDCAKVRELVHLLRNLRYPDAALDDTQQQLDQLRTELWTKATELVLQEQRHVVGLARHIADGLSAFSLPFKLSATELERLPALVERFGPSHPPGNIQATQNC